MKKQSFKNIILFSVFIIYLLFSAIIFYVTYNYYFESNRKNFIEKKTNNSQSIKDMIEEEKQSLIRGARAIAGDDLVFHAFQNNVYISNSWEYNKNAKELKINVKEINKYYYIMLANFVRNKIYGSGRGSEERGVELLDKNLEIAACSDEFNREFIDEQKEEFLKDAMGKEAISGVEISIIEERNGKYFIKGIAPVGRNSRYKVDTPPGVVVVGEEFSGPFIDKIKNRINCEVVVIKDNSIIISTIFDSEKRVENFPLTVKKVIADGDYFEVLINGNKYGITVHALYDYKNNIIGYVGSAESLKFLEIINRRSIESYFKLQAVAICLLFAILYLTIGRVFRPFRQLVNKIQLIGSGNYSTRADIKGSKEIEELCKSINSMTEEIEKRDKGLRDFNSEMEIQVNIRTKELLEKNIRLRELLEKIEKINSKNQEELEFARKIHEQIVKFEIEKIENYETVVRNWSINGIGGDFIDVIKLRNGQKGIFFADIAGHGVAAALMASAIKIIVNLYFADIDNPAEALNFLNDMIVKDFIPGVTISAVYLIINNKEDSIEVAQGAQEKSYVLREKIVEEIPGKGIILGVFESSEIDLTPEIAYKNVKIKLDKGDKIVIYTDGLIENKELDREKFLQLITKNRALNINDMDKLINNEIDVKIGTEKHDDITYLIIEKSC